MLGRVKVRVRIRVSVLVTRFVLPFDGFFPNKPEFGNLAKIELLSPKPTQQLLETQ